MSERKLNYKAAVLGHRASNPSEEKTEIESAMYDEIDQGEALNLRPLQPCNAAYLQNQSDEAHLLERGGCMSPEESNLFALRLIQRQDTMKAYSILLRGVRVTVRAFIFEGLVI